MSDTKRYRAIFFEMFFDLKKLNLFLKQIQVSTKSLKKQFGNQKRGKFQKFTHVNGITLKPPPAKPSLSQSRILINSLSLTISQCLHVACCSIVLFTVARADWKCNPFQREFKYFKDIKEDGYYARHIVAQIARSSNRM